MGDRLRKPIVVEAICEFRFVADTPWDWTIPGQLYDRIQADFPQRSQIQGMGFQLQASPSMPPVATIQTGPERVQLKRTNGSAMVQVGQNLLAINHFPPYPSWDEFRALILVVWNEYQGVTSETVLQRIGLRYINQIPLPTEAVPIDQWITLDPPLSGQLDRPLRGFYQRYELEETTPEGVLIHQTGIQNLEGQIGLVLDLDFGSTQVRHLKATEAVQAWLEAAHTCVYEAFVASLNPAFYEKLKRGDA